MFVLKKIGWIWLETVFGEIGRVVVRGETSWHINMGPQEARHPPASHSPNVGDGVMKVTLVMKVLNIKLFEHRRSKAHRRNLFAKPANLYHLRSASPSSSPAKLHLN